MCCHVSALGVRSQGRYRGVWCEKAWLCLRRELFCDILEARHPSSPGLHLERREIRTDGF